MFGNNKILTSLQKAVLFFCFFLASISLGFYLYFVCLFIAGLSDASEVPKGVKLISYLMSSMGASIVSVLMGSRVGLKEVDLLRRYCLLSLLLPTYTFVGILAYAGISFVVQSIEVV